MGDNTIDNLSIQISGNANAAVAAINSVASSFGKVNGAAKDAASNGLKSVKDEMEDVAASSKEAGKEANNFGKEAKNAGNSAKHGASGIERFLSSIKRILFYRAIRSVLRAITQAFKEGIGNLYQWSAALDGSFAKSMDTLATSALYLKNSIAAMVAPIIQAVVPALDILIDKVVQGLNFINMLFATISGQKTYTVAKKVATTWSDTASDVEKTTGKVAQNTKKIADEVKRTILGFDEINKLEKASDPLSSVGSGGTPGSSTSGKKPTNYGVMFEQRALTGGFKGFSDALEKAVKNTLSKIGMLLSGALFALGAILALSGANMPLGLALMATGIAGYVASVSWGAMENNVNATLHRILGIVSLATVAVGAILMLTGANVPLGVGMVAAGMVGTLASINWSFLSDEMQKTMETITKAVMLASVAVGAILALSGANVPLGIGLMVGGLVGSTVSLNWGGGIVSSIQNVLNNLDTILGAAMLGVGAVLTFSGANIPVGIAMMLSGIATTGNSLNWGGLITGSLQNVLKNIELILDAAMLGMGAVLAFSGANIPLGIALMIKGILGVGKSLNWGAGLTGPIQNVLSNIVTIVGAAEMGVGAILVFSGASIPLGIALLADGFKNVAQGTSLQWGTLVTSNVQNVLTNLFTIVSAAELAIGALLTFTGTNIPLGIGLIAAGAVGLAKPIAARWGIISSYMSGPLGTLTKMVGAATLVLGMLALFGGNIPLGIGLSIAGASTLGFYKAANATSLLNWFRGWIGSLTAIISTASLLLGIIALLGGNIPLGIGLLLAGATGLATSIYANWGSLKQLGIDAKNKVKEGWDSIVLSLDDSSVSGGVNANATSWRPNIDLSMIQRELDVLFSNYADFDVKVDLIKDNWTSVAEWVNKYRGGNNDQFVELKKSGWDTIDKWAQLYKGGKLNQSIALVRTGWTLISSWVNGYKGGTVKKEINLKRDGWTTVGNWVQGYTGTPVSQGIDLFVNNWYGFLGGISDALHSWFPTLFAEGGVIQNGHVSRFANGGYINAYAGGTSSAHGSLFLAGEAGPEIVGHVGGRTEVLNKSQLAATMYEAVRAAMSGITIDANITTASAFAGASDDSYMLAEYVRSGVQDATHQQNELLREQNNILRQLLDKPVTAEISTNGIINGLIRKNQRDGTTIVPVNG